MPLLEIRNLTVEFPTALGTLRAVDSIDLSIDPGEIVGIVGESGSGKSVAALAVMGLLPWTARVTADRLAFNGIDLLKISPADRRRLAGKDLAMIFRSR
jgi:dipeptide transport system ATP-binding protein